MRAATFVLGALVIAGCTSESPPAGPNYYYPASEPLPQAEARPAPSHHAAANEAVLAREIKPLGQGVLASNVVESYMDNQEAALRAGLKGRGLGLARTGNDLVLNIRNDQLFSGSSMDLSPEGQELVLRLAEVARRFDSTLLVVDAYTDTTGTQSQNMTVSQKRADLVAKKLAADGVAAKRVAAKGFGDEILKVPTGPNVAEPRNRRVEIKITPLVKA